MKWVSGLAASAAIALAPWMAAAVELNVEKKAPPAEIAEPIRAALSPEAVQLREGDDTLVEFWFVSELPLGDIPSAPNRVLDEVAEVTLLGVVAVHKSQRDYRDDEVFVDLYTMRFGLQPKDGNHLGTSLYDYFAILVMAELDETLEGFANHDQLVAASQTDTPANHPIILSLRPSTASADELPAILEPESGKESIGVAIPAKADGESATAVFELVYKGHGEL